jgi:hypothetical protein
MPEQHHPEIIQSDDVIHRGDVDRVETRAEILRVKASIGIAVASLLIACAVLAMAAYTGNTQLQTWATGLVSGIAGAAIAYGFNSRRT